MLTATNGLEGLDKARNSSPDLLTLDVMLPGMDGFEVCDRLRNDPETANLPVIMLSAKGQDVDKSAGSRAGADEYLTKPVDRAVLIKKVETLLAGTG